jgi:DNA-binding response OmpR family regulator
MVLPRLEGYELDSAARTLKREGHSLAIKPRTFDLFWFLAGHPHQLVTT